MTRAQHDTVQSLKESFSRIQKSNGNILQVSDTLNANAEQLADGANNQASSSEEISASMEQMVAAMEQNFMRAKESVQLATDTN